LDTLNLIGPDASQIEANWLWLDVLVILPFLVAHLCCGLYRWKRRNKTTSPAKDESIDELPEQDAESLAIEDQAAGANTKDAKLESRFAYFAIANASMTLLWMMASDIVNGTLYWREFAAWQLFLFLVHRVLLVLQGNNLDALKSVSDCGAPMLPDLFDAVCTGTVFAGVIYWSTTAFWKLPTFGYPDFVLFVHQPILIFCSLLKFPQHLQHVRVPGLAASFVLVMFVCLDWMWSGGAESPTNPFGWVVLSPDNILSSIYWLVFLLVQAVLGIVLRKIAAMAMRQKLGENV